MQYLDLRRVGIVASVGGARHDFDTIPYSM